MESEFYPNPSKQAQEVILLRKVKRQIIIQFILITTPFNKFSLRNILKCILILNRIFRNTYITYYETMWTGLLHKLHVFLPQQSLVTIYKAFTRPHLDEVNNIYDQRYNDSFHWKMESMQYNAVPAITGAIRSTSREKLYHELGLEWLCKRQWYRKLCYFFKISKGQSPDYLFKILPSVSKAYNTRTNSNSPRFGVKLIF